LFRVCHQEGLVCGDNILGENINTIEKKTALLEACKGGWSRSMQRKLYAHPASYPVGTMGSFPGGKAAGA